MEPGKRQAEIHFTKEGVRPQVEVVVPQGTLSKDLVRIHEIIDNDLIPRLTGCGGCYSGLDLIVRNRLDQVIRVDLESGQIIGR
jgi:hypothetical protein